MDKFGELRDRLEEIKRLYAAVRELTQQVIELSGNPDKMTAYDTARIATEEKLDASLTNLENFVCYGLKGEV